MEDTEFIKPELPFKANQIICLEHQDTSLYGEVIQLIPSRNLCWFRPIFMIKGFWQDPGSSQQLVNLHSGSDLLWPISLFRAALDLEVIGWLADLDDADKHIQQTSSRQCLNQFVQQVWEANKEKF